MTDKEKEEQKMIICVSLDEFIRYTIGEIYSLAPYHKPRFIEEIADGIISNFKVNCKSIGRDFFYHEVEMKNLYKFIENILMPIDKFRELNLSQDEYETGVKVEDEDRPKFAFVSALSDIPDDSDFVDLDACVQNIFCQYEHKTFREWLCKKYEIDLGDLYLKDLSEFREKYMADKGEEND